MKKIVICGIIISCVCIQLLYWKENKSSWKQPISYIKHQKLSAEEEKIVKQLDKWAYSYNLNIDFERLSKQVKRIGKHTIYKILHIYLENLSKETFASKEKMAKFIIYTKI